MLLSIETGRELEGTPLEAYASLARGNLDAAVRQANAHKEGRERVLRLVASSEGATRAMIDEALALPLDDSRRFRNGDCHVCRRRQDISAIRRPMWPSSRKMLATRRQAGALNSWKACDAARDPRRRAPCCPSSICACACTRCTRR